MLTSPGSRPRPVSALVHSTALVSPPFLDSESLSHPSALSAKAPVVSSIQSPVVYTSNVIEQGNEPCRDTSQEAGLANKVSLGLHPSKEYALPSFSTSLAHS